MGDRPPNPMFLYLELSKQFYFRNASKASASKNVILVFGFQTPQHLTYKKKFTKVHPKYLKCWGV